ncbi:nucleoside deaminase [Candidatus Phytoplasma sacchari]|uniref:Nucleoside deaminase n=1 Tax=Candidatus Phytoplasma sacchari TaxID=2609813 RepID=A0ABY7M194_9MOLU|nr:nucleoside deaminase [Candidatus Phytoplasma sacchari]KAB8122237.1 nucleoside deaminase [Candidatus Phytoplasma sacchari]WBL31485.1 nucleoside deaminase [Candidatus Phytoplasma sacchari]
MEKIGQKKHFFFMREAFKEAKKAFYKNEVPVGSIAVLRDKIIARAHNNIEKKKKFFAHAEFLVLNKLNQRIDNYKFEDISIYTTLEPCIMCMGALIQFRIKKLYYGANNIKSGFHILLSCKNSFISKKIYVKSGFLAEESSSILKEFFCNLRKK